MNDTRSVRPTGITILAIFILWFAAWNGLRLSEAIFFWKTLEQYGAYSLYISISGGVWLIAGLFLIWGLWQGKAWGWLSALGGTFGYTVWYWIDRLALQKPHSNWPFALIENIIFLIGILIILFSRRTKCFFERGV
jgi:hypothetical protein